MNKLSKSAKRIDSFFKAVYWLAIVMIPIFVVLFVINTVMSLQFAEEHPETIAKTVSLGSVNLNVAADYVPATDVSVIYSISEVILMIIALIFVCYAIKIIRKILKPMCEGLPFCNTVSVNLKKLAWISLIGGCMFSIVDLITEIAVYEMYDFENLFLSEKIVGCSGDFVFDLSFLVLFAIFYLLSYVFQYGEELQKQSDETL